MGGHVHVAVYQGRGDNFTWERNGELIFDEVGWEAFTDHCRLAPAGEPWVIEEASPPMRITEG